MKCTACNSGTLNRAYLQGTLPCLECNSCKGHFLKLTDYLKWLDKQPKTPNQGSSTNVNIDANETTKAMLCPETGKIMTKYRISKEIEHKIDLNSATNAVWLDSGEWQLLEKYNLHTKLNQIFTHPWQQKIRNEDSKEIMQSIYQRKFGEHYEVIKQFRESVCVSENKNQIIAYLLAEDPYKP